MIDWWKRPLAAHSRRGIGWFRIFGYGLHWKNTTQHPLMFSERVLGHGRQVGNWRFGWLKP